MNRILALALTVAAVAPAFANNPFLVNQGQPENYLINPKDIKVATPVLYAKIGRDMKLKSPWMPMPTRNQSTQNVPSFALAWDNWNTNVAALPAFAAHNAGAFGANTPNYRFGNEIEGHSWIEQFQTVAAGTAGRVARYYAHGTVWNPNGGTTRAGTLTLVQIHFPNVSVNQNGFDNNQGSGADGLAFQFANLAAGFYILSFDLSAATDDSGLYIPGNGGGIEVINATTDGIGNIQLSGVQKSQPIRKAFAGSEPWSSGIYTWIDTSTKAGGPWSGAFDATNNADYIFQDGTNTSDLATPFSEMYDQDLTTVAPVNAILHAAHSFAVDNNTRRIKGKLVFGDLVDPLVGPRVVELEVNGGAASNIVVAPDGSFEVLDPVQASGGVYDLRFKADHWLAKAVAAVDTTSGLVTDLGDVVLINGDIDGDNSVTIFDYIELSNNFDKTSEAPDWNTVGGAGVPVRFSDLDRDDSVTIFDYIILSNNFDLSGD